MLVTIYWFILVWRRNLVNLRLPYSLKILPDSNVFNSSRENKWIESFTSLDSTEIRDWCARCIGEKRAYGASCNGPSALSFAFVLGEITNRQGCRKGQLFSWSDTRSGCNCFVIRGHNRNRIGPGESLAVKLLAFVALRGSFLDKVPAFCLFDRYDPTAVDKINCRTFSPLATRINPFAETPFRKNSTDFVNGTDFRLIKKLKLCPSESSIRVRGNLSRERSQPHVNIRACTSARCSSQSGAGPSFNSDIQPPQTRHDHACSLHP